MASFPDLQVPLSDGSVSVRMAAERDIPEILIAYQDDPQLHLLMGNPRPPSGAELGRRAERAQDDQLAGRALALTVVEGDDDTCLGQIDVHHVEWEHGRAELGVWVAQAHRGRGVARRALGLAGPWLLTEAGLERVQLLTHPENQAMRRAAEAAGFQFEGVLHGYYRDTEGFQPRLGRPPAPRVDMAVLSLVHRDLRG
jgi:ribosomal-protein-alanine N-acetyltransferase